MEASNSSNIQTKTFEEPNLPSMTIVFHTKVNSSPPNLPPAPSTQGKNEPLCVYCNGKHHPITCKVIADPGKRYDCVKKANRCFNCLGRHRVSVCKSQERCLTCQRKHHTSLCSGKHNRRPITETNQDQSKGPSSVHATVTPITPVSINSTNINTPGTTCLLKTAIATVGSAKFKTEANILFDEGAQRSFVRQDLVKQLQIEPTRKENVCLSAFRSTTQPCGNLML